jgi:DNA-binding MarR family transcriptional regulator
MAKPDHEYCTCEALRRLTRRMTAVYDGHLGEVGLTVGQYALLVNIGAETLPLSRLARRTATDRTTLTRTLAPLIKAGWVVVVVPGEDARTRLVTLTEAGRRKATTAHAVWRCAQDQIGAALRPKLTAALHGMIDEAMTRLRPFVARN